MNPLTGLLIEYLVIGAVSLLWLIPLMLKENSLLEFLTNKSAGPLVLMAVPAIYVIGMLCDFIGYNLIKLSGLKDNIRDKVWKDKELQKSQIINICALCCEPILAKQIEIRSSRDRIARGAFVAFLPVIYVIPANDNKHWLLYAVIVAFMSLMFAFMWYRFEMLSTKFEQKSWSILKEKHNNITSCACDYPETKDGNENNSKSKKICMIKSIILFIFLLIWISAFYLKSKGP